MQFSINEIEALLSKAARGGGAPAGQASAFGKAGALHIARGFDAADVQGALDALPGGPILSYPVQLTACLSQGGGAVECPKQDLLRSYANGLPYAVDETEAGFTIDTTRFEKVKLPARITVTSKMIDGWRALAALTYVPETEQSRVGGAGAGLTDND